MTTPAPVNLPPINAKLSEHFTEKEMTFTQVRKPNVLTPEARARLKLLCEKVLEPIREHFKLPVKINSAYRAPEVNKAVGGAKNSQHMLGEAADIEILGVDNLVLAHWIANNLEFDQVISEFYVPGDPTAGWVHVSFREGNNRKQTLTVSGGKTTTGLPKVK
jgi:zinc D-Ala-D-Ala carboxypeptidase